MGQLFNIRNVVVHPRDKPIHPGTGIGRHDFQRGLRPAPEIKHPQRLVEIAGQRPTHFGNSSAHQMPRQLHLAKAQMGMDNSQSDRQIRIALSVDERHLLRVPVNFHRGRNRRARNRDRGQTRFGRDLVRQRREHSAAGQHDPHRSSGKQSGQSHGGAFILVVIGVMETIGRASLFIMLRGR